MSGVHRSKGILAAAAWKDLNALCSAQQAALLRGDEQTAKDLRQKAHDMLDTHLDLNGEIVAATLDLLKE